MRHHTLLRLLVAPLMAAVALAGAAQTTTRLSATKANDYGIVYTLPLTRLDIELTGRKTVRTPGKFYKYAKKYFNIDNPVARPEATVEVTGARILTSGVPDPDERYTVTFKSGSPVYVLVGADNIPLAVNINKSIQGEKAHLPESRESGPTPLETPAGRQALTQEITQSESPAKGAELAAAQIFALRESRNDLITGNADNMPPDGASLSILLENLEAQEAALMSLFTGTEQVSTFGTVVSYIPDAEDTGREVIARLSADGFVSPDNLGGVPVTLSVTATSRGEVPVDDKGRELPFPRNGLAYCIPGQAEVTVGADGRTLAERTVNLAQLGIVYGLNPNAFTDRKEPIYIVFDPATGALLEQGPAPVE